MKPHRRKDTPPRREQPDDAGQHTEGEVPAAPEEGAYEASPEPAPEVPPAYQDPAQMQYDPGQALVDPGSAYTEPPQQAAPDPGQVYQDPNQGYVDPNQGYGDPGQAFVDPAVPAPPPITSPAPAQQPAGPAASRAPRRKVATKKGARRRPGGGGRTGSRYQKPTANYGGGGVTVMGVFLFLIAIAMMVIVAFVVMPKDISHVKGYPIDPLAENKDQRNLLDEAQKIMVSRDKDLVISEEEVNQYLYERLQGEQTGMMSALVKFRGVCVDFSPGLAEVIVERELFGLPITMSARVRPELFQRQVLYRNAGWSIGKIEFNSRNIKPIIGMFERIRVSCAEEFNTMKQMADVRFEEDKVILDATL